jgi:glycosyltransferase involved in cell wall biosynthesis
VGSLTTPRVSIGLPVYNGENFLEDCLCSVLTQTHDAFELVISDNASDDRTAEICKAFAGRDDRIRYVRQERNSGAAANFNEVFRLCRGEYFKWMAHDDMLEPTWLERCVEALDASGPEVCVAYTAVSHLREEEGTLLPYDAEFPWGAPTPDGRLAQMLLVEGVSILTKCYPVFGLMRREALASTRLIQPFNASDKVLLVEMALRGDFKQVPEHLFHRRLHANNSLTANPTPQQVLEWFDPEATRPATVHKDLWDGYRNAVRDASLPSDQVRSCRRIVRRWAWKLRKRLAGDLLRGAGLR